MERETGDEKSESKQWPQWCATLSASIGCFMSGIYLSWSSPALATLLSPDSPFPTTESDASWIASLLQGGAALGAIVGCLATFYLGPKTAIVFSACPHLVGTVMIIFADSPYWLYASRAISGLGSGIAFISTPIYVSEIAENHIRGALTIVFNAALLAGALFMSTLGPYVSLTTSAEIVAIFPLILLATFVFAPESPMYHLRRRHEEAAIVCVQKLRGNINRKTAMMEVDEMKLNIVGDVSIVDSIKDFANRPNPKAFFLVALSMTCTELSGAPKVIAFMQSMYETMGLPFDVGLGVIIASTLMVLAGFFVVPFIDRLGRKPLVLFSTLGCILSNLTLGYYYQVGAEVTGYLVPFVAVNLFMVFFAAGLACIPFTLAGELFTIRFKEVAICLLNSYAGVVGFGTVKLHQVIGDSWGYHYVFYGYALSTALLAFLLLMFLPETKNKSFIEIQDALRGVKRMPENLSVNDERYCQSSYI